MVAKLSLHRGGHRSEAAPVRAASLIELVAPALCWSCRDPSPARGPLCPRCAAALPWLDGRDAPPPPGLDGCRAPLAFEGPARDLVHALKLRPAPRVARLMGAHLVHGAPPETWRPEGLVLVPAPASPWRTHARGIDHTTVLARELARRTGLPVGAALRRRGAPWSRQRGRTRRERLAGTALSVEASRPAPSCCLLVDDVMTTGATLAACAAALRSAGARRVCAVVYARVV